MTRRYRLRYMFRKVVVEAQVFTSEEVTMEW